jgi:uncharacterized OsmC-like protein
MTGTRALINGIDTDALRGMIRDVAARPSGGIARFQVATRWTGATRSETSVKSLSLGGQNLTRNYSIASDEPRELLGENAAPNPQELFLAALNACMTVGYVAGCALHGIELESLEIETEGQLDLRGFLGLDPAVKPGYDEVRYTVRIKGNGTPQQFREIHQAVMKTSPNYFNFANAIRMAPTLVIE